MDEKDRVFARFKGELPEAAERREQLTIPRPARASGSRVVEVIRVRSTATSKDRPRRIDPHVRAASWDGGFPAKRPAPTLTSAALVAAESVTPVTHVMPAWESAPTPPVVEAAPAQAVDVAVATRREPDRAPKAIRNAPARRVADPFDGDDDGANCLRCGYAIERDRDRRGLTVCLACE